MTGHSRQFPAMYFQPAREISSAAVEQLNSEHLSELRRMLIDARAQASQLTKELDDAKAALGRDEAELERRQASWFRFLFKRRIERLEESIPVQQGEVGVIEEALQQTHIEMKFDVGPAALADYGALVRAFDALRQSAEIWDMTSERDIDRVATRSAAARDVTRHKVRLSFADHDLIRFEGRAMQFENYNGEDILIYPGMALMPRPDGAFALIDLREIYIDFVGCQFIEAERVPADAKVIGETWAKVNKDGSRDLRFRDNYRLPICLYGSITFRSSSGVNEEYQFSRFDTAEAFVTSFNKLKRSLAAAAR